MRQAVLGNSIEESHEQPRRALGCKADVQKEIIGNIWLGQRPISHRTSAFPECSTILRFLVRVISVNVSTFGALHLDLLNMRFKLCEPERLVDLVRLELPDDNVEDLPLVSLAST